VIRTVDSFYVKKVFYEINVTTWQFF